MSRLGVRQTNETLGFNASVHYDPSKLTDMSTSRVVPQFFIIDGIYDPLTACLSKLMDKVKAVKKNCYIWLT